MARQRGYYDDFQRRPSPSLVPPQVPTPDHGIPRIADITMTRRLFLALRAMDDGLSAHEAVQAVGASAEERTDWDMDEERTWGDWCADLG